MTLLPLAQPGAGQLSECQLLTYPLQVVPGTWQAVEPQRVADKISTGDIRYQDFNPYESVAAQAVFSGGYGLQRYSDLADAAQAQTMVKEAIGVDCRATPVTLGPLLTTEAGLAPNGTLVWMGEVTAAGTLYLVAVGGTQVWARTVGGAWTLMLTLTAAPVQGAVGVFGQYLILGYGSARAAQATSDLVSLVNVQNDSAAALFAWAVTTDRASAYLAGGPAATQFNQVLASTDGRTYQAASTTVCGSSQQPITALAPGGGLVTLYVGKTTELGEIDNSGVYRVLVPYDSVSSNNSVGLRWFMGVASDEQRGPMLLLFPRDRALWSYVPSSQTAGQARNISPWADPVLRPPTVRGLPTAFQGTARYLYWAVLTQGGHSYLNALDARTGVSTTIADLGTGACRMLTVTGMFGNNPLLYCGVGSAAKTLILPLDGDTPLDDPSCRFTGSGVLDLPDIDLGLPDEDKIAFAVRVVADALVPNQQTIRVAYRGDGGVLTQLGTADASPRAEMFFQAPNPTVRRLGLRLTFFTANAALTPQLWAVTLRASLNAKLYREWHFQAFVPGGQTWQGDDLTNPATLISDLWAARGAGTPVAFVDRWGAGHQVRILELAEQETTLSELRGPESVVAVRLLEAPGSAAPLLTTTYVLAAGPNTWFPMGFPGNGLSAGSLSIADTLPNTGQSTVYPTVRLTGPATGVVLTANGQTWTYLGTIGAGQTVVANFTPTAKTVVDLTTGTDLSGNVTAGSVYWGLPPGVNPLTGALYGATSASSVVIQRSAY